MQLNDQERAIFPLKTVLFPHAEMPLVIFEPRYLEMVSYCLEHNQPFLVAQLISGQEVVKQNQESAISYNLFATEAFIVDFDKTANGSLLIRVKGGSRVVIKDSYINLQQLHVAKACKLIEPVADIPIPHDLTGLADILEKLCELPEVNLQFKSSDFDSCDKVVNQLAQLLPLDLEFKQYLLEEDDCEEKAIALYEQLVREANLAE